MKRFNESERIAAGDGCPECGNPLDEEECWNCGGEGLCSHECGDDSCACLDPEPNVECHVCGGTGILAVCGWCKEGAP